MDGENGTGHDMVPILQNLPAKYTEDEYQTLYENFQRERERERELFSFYPPKILHYVSN